jgi:hypothetical protein
MNFWKLWRNWNKQIVFLNFKNCFCRFVSEKLFFQIKKSYITLKWRTSTDISIISDDWNLSEIIIQFELSKSSSYLIYLIIAFSKRNCKINLISNKREDESIELNLRIPE